MGGRNTKKRTDTNSNVEAQTCLIMRGLCTWKNDEKDKEDPILKAIKDNDIDTIKRLVTPKGLVPNCKNCKDPSLKKKEEKEKEKEDDKSGAKQENDDCKDPSHNVLERSLQVSFYLKKARGPKRKKFKLDGDKVEDFACRLLEYSKGVPERQCIKKLADTALKFKAKKFLAAPQIQSFLQELWVTSHYKGKDTSYKWILLNLWTILEFFLFPFVMLSLFVHHILDKEYRNRPKPNDPITKLPKKTMKKFANLPISLLKDRNQTIAEFRLQYVDSVQEIDKCIEGNNNPITELPGKTIKKFDESLLEKPNRTIAELKKEYDELGYSDSVQEIDKCLKDPYDRYKDHFKTPYFIFLRDMLSYITLLVFHYMVCVQTTGLQFSVLEWIIMVLFVGRVVFEVHQCIKEESLYIADFWNKVDVASIVVYIFTIICRGLVKQPKSDLLVMASYSYGINAMLLTLRVFGQFMELKESTGTKQIALLKIIKAVAVIFVQIVSVMLGFSFVLTKIYMADVSHLAETNATHGVCGHSVGIKCWWYFFEFLAWSIVGSGDRSLLSLENGFSNYISKVLFLFFLIVTAVVIMNMLIALLSNTYQEVEDNAFNEWAYRKAFIIKTYYSCHPVPVPFCIISIPLKLFYKCYQKHCLNRTSEKETQKEEEEEDNQKDNKKLLKKLCKDIQEKYFAEYGNCFSQDSLSGIDRQLSENKRLMGHIANELFKESITSPTVSDIQEWDCSEGINAVGRQLFHVKCEYCKNQRTYRYCVHGARHKSSLSREWPGFEVLIQHSGKKRYIGIGVASSNYELYDFPGRKPDSVGYHVDTGGIFDKDNLESGHTDEDSMSFAGDLVGCMVLFDEKKDHETYLRVQFTRNGRILGEAKLDANLIENIHPLISMAFSGIHVMFRKIRKVQGAPFSSSKVIQDMEILIEQLQRHVAEAAQNPFSSSGKIQDMEKSIEHIQRHVAETAQNLKCLEESVYKKNQADNIIHN